MDLVDDGLHAIGPFGWIGDEVAGTISVLGGPAVVDVYVGVSEVFEAEGDEFIGCVEGVLGRGGGTLSNVL